MGELKSRNLFVSMDFMVSTFVCRMYLNIFTTQLGRMQTVYPYRTFIIVSLSPFSLREANIGTENCSVTWMFRTTSQDQSSRRPRVLFVLTMFWTTDLQLNMLINIPMSQTFGFLWHSHATFGNFLAGYFRPFDVLGHEVNNNIDVTKDAHYLKNVISICLLIIYTCQMISLQQGTRASVHFTQISAACIEFVPICVLDYSWWTGFRWIR